MRNSTLKEITLIGVNPSHTAKVTFVGTEIRVESTLPLAALVDLLTDGFWLISYAQLKAAHDAARAN